MKIFGFTLFLTFVVLPASLFAQSVGGTSSGSSSETVTNLSEVGGFIGSGRPEVFVGTGELFNSTSSTRNASSTTRARNTRATTTQRRTATSTAAMQRRAGTLGGFSSLGSSNQTIRSITSLDSDIAVAPAQRPLPAVDSHLSRIPGIEDGRVTFNQSSQGTTAIIKGTVASDRERRVAQQLLLMEPGIDRVENLLKVR